MIFKARVIRVAPTLLFWGFFFTPFTSLRFGVVGPGEIMIVVAAIVIFFASHGRIAIDGRLRILSGFWALFLLASLCGLFYNALVLGFASGLPFSPVFDLFAYFFILLSILIVGHLAQNNQISAASFFTKLFSLWAVTYSALYGLSFVTTSIFGMPLRYYHFFSPLVDNVHQAASITCVMGFIMFFLALRAKSVLARLLYLVSAVLFAKMALDSGSTKAFLGVLFGVVVSVVFLVVYRPSGRNRFVFNILALTGFVAAIFAFIIARGDLVANVAIRFFMESDGGGAREALYSVGLAHGMKSFLVGYGPGSHAPYGGGFSDAHNTTLTVFLQGGLVGVLALVALAARFARELTVSPVLIGAATAIGMYFLGGDILRRLPTWIMMIGVVYFAREIHLARKSRALGTGHEIHSDPRVPHGQNASRFDKGRPVNQFPQVVKNR